MATQLAEMPDSLGGGEVAEQDNTEVQSPQARDPEAEARELGWKPREEWDGRGEWRDAEAFLEFREGNLALKKKEVDHLKREMEALKKTIRRLSASEQRAYETARADLERERLEAVQAGDVDSFNAVQKKVDKLDKEVRAEVGQQVPNIDAEDAYDSFRDANGWYDRGALAAASDVEVDARAYADRLADRYSRQGKHLDMAPDAFFQMIADETLAKYPALTQKQPRQKPASDVAGPTGRVPQRGAKTGANLPPEAKRQAERFFQQGIIKGKTLNEALDNYAKSYQW